MFYWCPYTEVPHSPTACTKCLSLLINFCISMIWNKKWRGKAVNKFSPMNKVREESEKISEEKKRFQNKMDVLKYRIWVLSASSVRAALQKVCLLFKSSNIHTLKIHLLNSCSPGHGRGKRGNQNTKHCNSSCEKEQKNWVKGTSTKTIYRKLRWPGIVLFYHYHLRQWGTVSGVGRIKLISKESKRFQAWLTTKFSILLHNLQPHSGGWFTGASHKHL